MQLDADEDGEPFFKPQQPTAAPPGVGKQKEQAGDDGKLLKPQTDLQYHEGETAQAAAATATAEQEE